MGGLFKDLEDEPAAEAGSSAGRKAGANLDSIKELQEKLAIVIDKVKSLKEEKSRLESRVSELEAMLSEKEDELRTVSSDKLSIRDQITDLLNELEAIEA